MTTTAKTHIEKVKSLPCCVCGEGPPTDAHHITQGRTPGRKVGDRLTIPLCKDCHQGSINGIHGQRRMWDVMRKSEFDYLDETIERVYG